VEDAGSVSRLSAVDLSAALSICPRCLILLFELLKLIDYSPHLVYGNGPTLNRLTSGLLAKAFLVLYCVTVSCAGALSRRCIVV
jgi:hypothetical protein